MSYLRNRDNLNKLLFNYSNYNFSDKNQYNAYKVFIEHFVELNKPDFVALLNLKEENKVLYSKNYRLKFDDATPPLLNEIIKAIDSDQLPDITKIDLRYLEFAAKNEKALQHMMFRLFFTANLIENEQRTYMRKISLLPKKYLDSNQTILIVTISDVTGLTGIQKSPNVLVRCYCESENYECLKFNKELNNILAPTINLTARQREILNLIADGLTSEEIAKKLFISIFTVQTHRQNLIKKFSVRNTAALVKLL